MPPFRSVALLLMHAALCAGPAPAQSFATEEIHPPKDPGNVIQIMVLGDGYTKERLTQDLPQGSSPTSPSCVGCPKWASGTGAPSYHRAVKNSVDAMFGMEPFKSYEDAFGVTRMDVESQSVTNTYFSGEFVTIPLWKRMLALKSPQRADKLDALLAGKDIAASIIIQNDNAHGGGTLVGVSWVYSEPTELLLQYSFAHELGHNLFGLMDEYFDTYELDAGRRQGIIDSPNVDLNADPLQTKWARWVGFPGSETWPNAFGDSDYATEKQFPEFNGRRAIGAYPGGAMVKDTNKVYHSRPTCLMNFLFIGKNGAPNAIPPICEICREAAVDRIAERYRIVSAAEPNPEAKVDVEAGGSGTFTLRTDVKVPTGLKIEWQLTTGEKKARVGTRDALSITLTAADLGTTGLHHLTALVKDAAAGPPNDRYKKLPYEVHWTIELLPPGRTAMLNAPSMLPDTVGK